jgi:hypothetical protein
MNTNINKTKNTKLNAFWKVYREDITWGYLIKLNEKGLKVLLNKEEKINDDKITVKINPPEEINIDSIDVGIHQLLIKPNTSLQFNEIDCQFHRLTVEQKSKLKQLIRTFEKDNQ